MYKLCKTEQSAARQRDLELQLLELMKLHRYEEISVSDFCAFAGIPRKAFYRYFSSKDGALYALLDHTMMEYQLAYDPLLPEHKRDLQMGLEVFFRFWKDQKPLMDALEYSGLDSLLPERTIAQIVEDPNLLSLYPEGNSVFRDYVIRFSICGLMNMVVIWHKEGYRESVGEMTRIAMRLLSRPLFDM